MVRSESPAPGRTGHEAEDAIRIRDADQIRALGVPVRQEILDSIYALQPCAVSEVARHLGRRTTAIYHHVRILLANGLIAEHGLRATGRRPEMLYGVLGDMRVEYDPADPENKELVKRLAEGILRTAGRDFSMGFEEDSAVVDGMSRNLWAGRVKLWLTGEELEELNEILVSFVELRQRKREHGRTLHALSWLLAPSPDRS